MNWNDILNGLLAAAAYIGVAAAVLVVGFIILDLLTPGKLATRILDDRDPNAALLASTNMLAAGAIVFSAIWHTDDDFVTGLLGTAIFGLVGIALLAVVDLIVDLLTPGKLHEVLGAGDKLHPGTFFVSATHLVVGAIVAASIVP